MSQDWSSPDSDDLDDIHAWMALGFERYSDPGRTWVRIPTIYKDYYAVVSSGDALDMLPREGPEAPQ